MCSDPQPVARGTAHRKPGKTRTRSKGNGWVAGTGTGLRDGTRGRPVLFTTLAVDPCLLPSNMSSSVMESITPDHHRRSFVTIDHAHPQSVPGLLPTLPECI